MVARRRYAADRVSSGTSSAVDAPAEASAAPHAAAAEAAPTQPQAENPFTAHLRALAAAEEEQRRAAAVAHHEAQVIAQQINSLGISEHKKRFLRSHPGLLQPQFLQLAERHHQAALARGVEDDTAEMNDAILAGVHADLQRAQASALAMTEHPAQPMPPAAQAAVPPAPPMPPVAAAPAPAMPATPPRRGPPVSAPVSRGAPGGASYGQGRVELSPAEREAARISGISDHQYAKNKQRLQAEKAAGRYLEPS
jgi:hypothetical protein